MPLGNMTETSVAEALRDYERLFANNDVEGIVGEFADDVFVRFSAVAPFRGKDKLRELLHRRFSAMENYRVEKRLEFMTSKAIAASWTGRWIEQNTGASMEGFGTELLTVENGFFVEWLANFSVWENGQVQKVA